MITSTTRLKRLMVPHWRSLRLTVRAKELSASVRASDAEKSNDITPELRDRLQKWRAAPSLVTAAELVETAIVDGQDEEAIPAARALLQEASSATPSVQTQAAFLLRRAGKGKDIPSHINLGVDPTKALWRRRTRLNPHSALGWVELALGYTIDGHLDNAQRAIVVALQLAPNNRHVLRSAARFFLHRNDALRAYDVIAKSEAVRYDPWLVATELALAEQIDRDPRFYKAGAAMLDDEMLPRQITELAGSMATKELLEGNRKKARRFFRVSMLDPNANALAQAEWATPNFGDALFSTSTLNMVEEAHEARAYYLSRDGQFSEVYAECEAWGDSEPYSIRPCELWASTANVLDDHEKAEEVTRRGLKMRANAPLLLNSRAYALAGLKRFDEAEAALNSLPSNTADWVKLVAGANRGLIAFRRGQASEGMALYQTAIDGFQKLGSAPMMLSAKIYLCREMIRHGLVEGPRMLEVLRPQVSSSNIATIKKVFKDAETFLAARKVVAENDLFRASTQNSG